MTKTEVWEQMCKTASYIYGIEQYTIKKRRNNRGSNWLILIVSVPCAISSFFPEVKWVTIITSILVVIITLIKDFKPILGQSEEELRELDDICDFYKRLLTDLEAFFSSQCNDSSEFTDEKRKTYKSILDTVGNRETKMKRLCRDNCWESKKAKQKTKNHLRQTFPDAGTFNPYCGFD